MSTSLISSTSSRPAVDRSYFASSRMIVSRALNLVFPLVIVVLLAVSLGMNNSSSASDLPESAVNCSNNSDRFYLYTSDFLTRSINIFCGIWLGFCCLAVIYQTIVFIIISMNLGDINYRRLLSWDIGLNSFFMWIFIDGAAGTFLMGFLWSAFNGATDLQGGPAGVAVAIIVLQYIAFIGFIICMSHYYSMVMQTSIYASRSCSSGGCSSNRACGSSGADPLKDLAKDSDAP